jgi:RNA polymerase sigma-70 factor, ECF subfamily
VSKSETVNEILTLQALQKGNEDAFEVLFNTYSKRLYYVAFQYLNDRDETLEIVQDVFLKVWLNKEKINPELPFIPYIIRIAKNLIINKAKKKLVENAYISFLEYKSELTSFPTEEKVLFNEVSEIVNKLINKFPPKRKEIFILSRHSGLSVREIAQKLQISESTVENHINKALKTLKSKLKTFGYLTNIIFLIQIH